MERQAGVGEQIKKVNRTARTSRDAVQERLLQSVLETMGQPAYPFGRRGKVESEIPANGLDRYSPDCTLGCHPTLAASQGQPR
ncbi:MAG: hypothetical protein ACYTGS_18360, partial [Planctomycetota bacterium]